MPAHPDPHHDAARHVLRDLPRRCASPIRLTSAPSARRAMTRASCRQQFVDERLQPSVGSADLGFRLPSNGPTWHCTSER